MQHITIREIKPEDNQAIAAVIRNTLAEFGANKPGTVYYDETTDHLYELFRQPGSVYFILEDNGAIAGGAGIYPSPGLPEKTCELVKMYLEPRARGKGFGRELISRCLHFAASSGYRYVYLETMPELKKAMGIYEKFGFRYLNGPLGKTGHFGCGVWMMSELV